MTLTVGVITLIGYYILGFPIGASVLLGAVLAPTDPVLASEVQVEHEKDRDEIKLSLTGEAGLNDGTAFPFVMLGLGLIGLHDLGESALKWVMIDLFWAVGAGLLVGAGTGFGLTKLVRYFEDRYHDTDVLEDFICLGTIAMSYGVAHLLGAYGFLSVFAAAWALRLKKSKKKGVLSFTEQIERIGETCVVVLLGSLLQFHWFSSSDKFFVFGVIFLVRPVAAYLGLIGSDLNYKKRAVISWFGIRGVGSIYYLTYSFHDGVWGEMAEGLSIIVLMTITVSIFVHGVSAGPFMKFYSKL
jgi:sodium/hydrogen antiporter